jgi:hypothetical protein
MAKFLAKDIVVKKGSTVINHLRSIEHNPSTERADMTTFSSTGGRKESIVIFRGDTFVLQGLANPSDTGQAAVNVVAQAVGSAAEAAYSIIAGGNTYTFNATAEVKLFGGGLTDGATWQCTLEVTGAIS